MRLCFHFTSCMVPAQGKTHATTDRDKARTAEKLTRWRKACKTTVSHCQNMKNRNWKMV